MSLAKVSDRSLALLRQPKDNNVGGALRFARLPPLGLASLAIGLGLRPPQAGTRPEPSLASPAQGQYRHIELAFNS